MVPPVMKKPRRETAYIGVLVDDLITCGTQEPYRMFTSRAEYRLLLREDNADIRLTETGYKLGLIDEHRWRVFNEKLELIAQEQQRLHDMFVRPGTSQAAALQQFSQDPLKHECRVAELLKRPEFDYKTLMAIDGFGPALQHPQAIEQVEIKAKYAGYIKRQHQDIDKMRRHEETALPMDFDYEQVKGLSNEVRQKLKDTRPATLGQAGRISGVTPAAISLLLVQLKKMRLVA